MWTENTHEFILDGLNKANVISGAFDVNGSCLICIPTEKISLMVYKADFNRHKLDKISLPSFIEQKDYVLVMCLGIAHNPRYGDVLHMYRWENILSSDYSGRNFIEFHRCEYIESNYSTIPIIVVSTYENTTAYSVNDMQQLWSGDNIE